MKTISLDIDGVLLNGRAIFLPNNIKLIESFGEKRITITDFAKKVEFDPTAIAILDRLVKITNSKILLHSNWRRRFDNNECLEIIISKGLKREWFHENPFPPIKMSSEKCHEIEWWLENMKKEDPEHEIIILDDHQIYDKHYNKFLYSRQILIHPHNGLDLMAYEKALDLFECGDEAMEFRPY